MALVEILIFTAVLLVWRLVFGGRGRNWFLFGTSILVIFWLQPVTAVRYLDFWLPVATLTLAAVSWAVTSAPETRSWRETLSTAAVLLVLILAISLTRYFDLSAVLANHRPPQIGTVLLACVAIGVLFWALLRRAGRAALWALFALLIVFFVILKNPALTVLLSRGVRLLSSQPTDLATVLDIRWLGFSYVAFRLIHTVRDRQAGRLPDVNLREYLTYVVFFPAFTAGPIDRMDRFVKDLRSPLAGLSNDLEMGGTRLMLGLFKKFALADTLAIVALNTQNAGQVVSSGWLWLLAIAYSLLIFFDFSGYTDIAIGLGHLCGIRLPENFNKPYLKPNLTQFWNNWHMTLTQWFRAYYFNPLTRTLRRSYPRLPQTWLVFLLQTSTMVLIGLWHGITWSFVLWGAWHAAGLFIHNRWTQWVRPHLPDLSGHIVWNAIITVITTLVTFLYVTLGWVWFVLPDPTLAWQVIRRLLFLQG
ncbi:MAG: MBOAT family protein [Anaerolineaceae bacterium]|nr:MBOAT family protein [Anaerolineaceae bacterium]